jgi:hypothetical protein
MTLQIYEGQLAVGWISDVANPPQLVEIAMSMQSHRSIPIPMDLIVHDPDGGGGDVLLPVRATHVRTVYPAGWDEPEYEFEGYVVARRSDREQTWVRGALRTNGEMSIKECTIYVLEPGAELGLVASPNIA